MASSGRAIPWDPQAEGAIDLHSRLQFSSGKGDANCVELVCARGARAQARLANPEAGCYHPPARRRRQRPRNVRKLLIILDDTPEMLNAMRYAAVRASKTGGAVEMLAVISPEEFQQKARYEAVARSRILKGFGFYPRSRFIHIDLGPARSWGERFPKRGSAFAVENPAGARGAGGKMDAEGGGCVAGVATVGAAGVDWAAAVTPAIVKRSDKGLYEASAPNRRASCVIRRERRSA